MHVARKRRHSMGMLAIAMMAPFTVQGSLVGPIPVGAPYASFADSPFNGLSFTSFTLEDFEDATLASGFTASGGNRICGGATDSVDGDDGAIDGSGSAGCAYFGNGLRFDFTGALPTHAGIVWTDGGNAGETATFFAWDENGVLLGSISGNHADSFFTGQTGEDRFYGAMNPGGISAIMMITGTSAPGFLTEVDHLQFGIFDPGGTGGGGGGAVPEPSSIVLTLAGAAALLLARRNRA